MNLQDVYAIRVPRKERRRVGRGWGSGLGKTSGRGEKGAGRRSGTRFRMRFEGGQMPLYRRLPKKGFGNHSFRLRFEAVNVGALEKAFGAGATVDIDALRAAHLVPKTATLWKLLGDGELSKKLSVRCDAASAGAKAKVEKAGGTVEVVAGDARERLEAGAVRRAETAKKRVVAVEAYKAEAVKAGKPKKAAAPGKGKGGAGKPAKPAGGEGGKPESKGGDAKGGKPAPKKDQG
ncbi:MAG: 50S ribosomal protein L15 [Planctomycetes bacterium]|nr:50S ribosomal protein L15 [Planctomycetota bacterium]